MKKKIKTKRPPQINFHSAELAQELKEVSDITKIPQADIARVALREKLGEMREKISNGEDIAITI